MSVSIDGTNGITFPNSSTQVQSAGLGSGVIAQTWQNVTSSRAVTTVYTNSTGYPIQVAISVAVSGADQQILLTVGGVVLYSGSGYTTNGHAGIQAIVPNGATYSMSSSGVNSIQTWNELR
jgi:hypothetical protein